MDNLPKPSERGNMMILLIIALLFLAALVFFLMSKQNVFSDLADLRSSNGKQVKEEATPSSKMKISPVEKEASASSSPSIPLYSSISWEQTAETPDLLKDAAVISDNTTNASANIHLDGRIWTYNKDNIKTMEEFNADSSWGKIIDYYQSEGEKQGWSYSKTVGNYTVSGINADGGGSSAYGLVKVNGDNVQAIMLLSTTTFASGEFPVDATCPCSQTYYVFESNKVPLDTLTKQLNN